MWNTGTGQAVLLDLNFISHLEGETQYVYVGLTRPIHEFYVRGCSHDKGGRTCVLLDRRDCNKQALQVVESLGLVTTTFPMINLT